MEMKVNKFGDCYYEIGVKRFYAGKITQVEKGQWYAVHYYDDFDNDFFSDEPFKTKKEAIAHIDLICKGIFKRILDNE